VNYLPKAWRDALAPHVKVYSARDLDNLFRGLPVQPVTRTVIYGGYDNFIARLGGIGKAIRAVMQGLERTALRWFGLSHFRVMEKVEG
jgi:hypothetical protein